MAAGDDDFINAANDWLEPRRKKNILPEQPDADVQPVREYAVVWIPVFCPNCGVKDKNVYCSSSREPVRYHKCATCGLNFKSIELVPDPVQKIREQYFKKSVGRA